ncbi:MAG: hypothetical protein ACE5KX_05480 [Acidimicrobiia bacterium]
MVVCDKLDLLEHSGTGRPFAGYPHGAVELLVGGLQFANGVALEAGEQSLRVMYNPYSGRASPWVAGPPGFHIAR